MKSMIEKLAYSLGRNDEEANIELAKELVKTKTIHKNSRRHY